ncbi:MAG: MCE family protein [Micromonosporaceae bacterium]
MFGFARGRALGGGEDRPREQTGTGAAAHPQRLVLTAGIIVVAAAIVASTLVIVWPRHHRVTVTAYFTRAIGVYPGSDVDILGVKVGTVSTVTPQGNAVRVVFSYDAKYAVPAGAEAMIVSPSLVSDRYVQLTPVYTRGPVLRSGAVIPQSRTAIPVEPDEATAALTQLSQALGPNGANSAGALSKLLQVGAANLQGEGSAFHQTLSNASQAASALADNSGNFAQTVTNLDRFISALAANDTQLSSFTSYLSSVSVQLNNERPELRAALRNLAVTLGQVAAFIRHNRANLAGSIDGLARVTAVLVEEKASLETFLQQAPEAAANTNLAYDSLSRSLLSRINLQQTQNLSMWVCSLVYSLGVSPKQCQPLLQPLNFLGQTLGQYAQADASWLTTLTTHINVKQPPPDAYGPGGKPAAAATSSGTSTLPSSTGAALAGLIPSPAG